MSRRLNDWICTAVGWRFGMAVAVLAVVGAMSPATIGSEKGHGSSLLTCTGSLCAPVEIRNTSDHESYDVVWDGAYVGTVRAGETLQATADAGVHQVDFKFTDSPYAACSVDPVAVRAGASGVFVCGRDRR